MKVEFILMDNLSRYAYLIYEYQPPSYSKLKEGIHLAVGAKDGHRNPLAALL